MPSKDGAKVKTVGRSLTEFRSAHDKSFIVPKKITEALVKLGDNFEYEVDFMRLAGVSTTDLATFREQFGDHIVMTTGKAPKRVWFGSKKVAAQAREMT